MGTAMADPILGGVKRRAAPSVAFTLATFLMAFWILSLLLTSALPATRPASAAPLAGGAAEKPPLVLGAGDKFRIGIFSDLHFGENEDSFGITQDIQSTEAMRAILGNETGLNLVVVNGDLITGENTFRENSSNYVHQVVAPLVAAGVRWASTYGNHDSKFNLSRERTFATESAYALSYTRRGDSALPGVTNYYLLLRRGDRPVAVLWFFDSRGGATYGRAAAIDHDDIPNTVAPETAAWFRNTSAALRAEHGNLHALAFVHIPPHVYLAAQSSERPKLDPARFPGVNDDVPVAVQGDAPADDQAFVDALLAEGVHSVYVGHDHGAAWCGLWPSKAASARSDGSKAAAPAPFLCFSKHTGHGGYGTWRRGARVVELSFVDTDGDGDFDDWDEMKVETWVRLEQGDVVTRVSLNATYGVDRYPTYNGEAGS